MSRRRSPDDEEENDDINDITKDFEVEQDDANRRQIRHQYRELMQSMYQNRDDMLSSRSNKLTDTLHAANQLFAEVSKPREAALDAQLLVLATNLGKEKANQLQADMTVFDPTSFAEDLLSFMGINRLENPDSDSEDEGCAKGYLGVDAWQKLGTEANKFFKRTPTFHFMLGSFKTEPPVARQKIERQKRASKVQEKSVMPSQLKKMEESHQEATEKEVERILGFLQTYFREDLENIFHVSFIIRDGFARINLDSDKLPVIEPIAQDSESQVDKENQPRYQGVISLSHQDWKEIVETFEIEQPMIPPP
ncbi:non-structural maintenance of chromosomes element 4 homolog A isoform X2 [Bufo gargarizans]|uniref:non-structural maintenance of chromosomes element 4 homolog A isoform X2 n=1 Tax=Bufo gargarizans TaxID=30331 RepID=UPI001CF3F821|nr:non-structural maintenance of chromosomes element 4 homolog A isoform X2 [Bufo gargarizans]